ncbi:MAG: hypothetical protein M1830_009176 [Pleopsidium flavum]|nr:MAG: hypothetical protein M1830_009176 [Pleopsidium flavum]
MAIVTVLSPINALFYVLCSYGVYLIYWQLTTGALRRCLITENGCQPAKEIPAKDPILGLDVFIDNYQQFKQHKALEWSQKKFLELNANTIVIKLLRQRVIFTAEPENIKAMLALNFKSWSIGKERIHDMKPFLGEGIFTTDGAVWQHSRDMLRPNLVRSQVGDLKMFENHVDNLIQAIPRDGSTVDLQDLFFRLSLDISTGFLFGESTDCLAPGISTVSSAEFAKAFTYCQNPMERTEKLGIFGFFLPDFQFKKYCKVVHSKLIFQSLTLPNYAKPMFINAEPNPEFVDDIVEKSLAIQPKQLSESAEDSRYIFLQALIAQTNDKIKIRSELLNILLAGRDTTASLLSNVWHSLAIHPAIYARLRAEISHLDPNKPPSFEELKNLKYLRAILNESLRLHPVVPANGRQAVENTTLPLGGGKEGKNPVFIPKGMVVGYSVYAMHRRRDLFGEDAEDFRPERWLDGEAGETKGLRPTWEYLPFNGGPRICIGQQFALTEASYVTVRLLQEFTTLESRDPEPWREKLTLTCTGLGGCKVAMTPRGSGA